MLSRRAPRSQLKTVAITITVLGLLYYFYHSSGSSPAPSTSLNKETPAPRWTPRGKGAAAAPEVHGDAQDAGFKKAPSRVEPIPQQPERVRVAAPPPPIRKAPPAPAPGRKLPIGNDREEFDRPAVRKNGPARMDVQDVDAAFAKGAKAVDRNAPPAPRVVEEVPRYKVVDDDLDGAQKGGRGGKGRKKKLPLGGGWKPVAEQGVPGAGQDKWGNAGWQARFKQKAGGAAAGAGAAAALGDDDASSTTSAPSVPELRHPLVARYADLDLTRDGKSAEEDTFQANPVAKAVDVDSSGTYNLTVCALIPGEGRFLSEWLLYHRLLGVDHFVLYDTSAGAAVGAAEVDGLADRMEAEGKGALGPTVDEIKAGVARAAGGGLDDDGLIYAERIAGLEHWIDAGLVTVNYMDFKDTKSASSFHQQFIDHCSSNYAKSTNFLAHLDIDEFLHMTPPLYGHPSPYRDDERAPPSAAKVVSTMPWRYPLHDLLARPATAEAACVPVPQLKYRNLGVRKLGKGESVLETQTRRNAIKHGNSPEKTIIHPAYTKDFVKFDGPHSCKVSADGERPEGVGEEIRNSQGVTVQDGGVYSSTRLPTEPLAIAHYVQRSLSDCLSKMGAVVDPNAVHTKGRGAVICEEQYMPSQSELDSASFNADAQNRFLLRTPTEGTVVEDPRMRDSWAAKATKAILQSWKAKKGAAPSERLIKSARKKVHVLSF